MQVPESNSTAAIFLFDKEAKALFFGALRLAQPFGEFVLDLGDLAVLKSWVIDREQPNHQSLNASLGKPLEQLSETPPAKEIRLSSAACTAIQHKPVLVGCLNALALLGCWIDQRGKANVLYRASQIVPAVIAPPALIA